MHCKCKKRAHFALPGNKAQYCAKCRPLGAINVRSKRCFCNKAQPHFGLPGEKTALWCSNCRPIEAVDIYKKKCLCNRAKPNFGLFGDVKARFCVKCKPLEAINLTNKMCICGNAQPSFGLDGDTKPRFCASCPKKPLSAINIRRNRCECTKHIGSFGMPGDKRARWCHICKPVDAINVTHKKCICGRTVASFGFPNEKTARWCSKCKPKEAVNIRSRLCLCKKSIAHFGMPGDKTRKYCAKCKPAEAVDIVHKHCLCNFTASFNVPGQSPAFCSQCKTTGMVRFPMKQCKKCKSLAIWGLHDRIHCEAHKEEGEWNLVERPCVSCGLLEVLNVAGLCSNCEPEKWKTYIKRKETHIRNLLIANELHFDSHDKIANASCGKERPDFLFQTVDHIVILEVDEDQHKTYQCACEQTRMINLTQAFGGISVFWIRYNPDSFKGKAKVTQKQRETHLLEWIRWALKREPKSLCEVLYLFYDGCGEKASEEDIQTIDMSTLHKRPKQEDVLMDSKRQKT